MARFGEFPEFKASVPLKAAWFQVLDLRSDGPHEVMNTLMTTMPLDTLLQCILGILTSVAQHNLATFSAGKCSYIQLQQRPSCYSLLAEKVQPQ